MKDQKAQVVDWLEDHGFDSDARSISFEALSNELKKRIPPIQEALNPAPDASPTPQLTTVEPDPAKPLDRGYLAILDFLKTWTPKKGVKDPYHGAWTGALNAAAEALGVSFGRAKQKYDKTATDEINRLRKAAT
jgi:hypothetical protein